MAISELHHVVIQALMSRRNMSEKTAKVVYAKCVEASGVDPEEAPDYVDILDEINSELEPFGFGIKRFMDEFTGRAWVAFCNVKSDEIAKVATEYGPQEISYFRTLIKLIMRSGKRYAIKGNEAKKAGQYKTVTPPLTATQAQSVLSTFVANGWLVSNIVKHGSETSTMYSLSPRSRMELEYYLTEEFPRQASKDFECKICNELVMRGRQCTTPNCNTRMHEHCGRAWLARQNADDVKCPKCRQTSWVMERLSKVGPESVHSAYDGESETEDEEEDDSQVEVEDSDATPPPPPTRPGRRGTTNGSTSTPAKPESDDDDDEDVDQLDEDEEEEGDMQQEGSSSRRGRRSGPDGAGRSKRKRN